MTFTRLSACLSVCLSVFLSSFFPHSFSFFALLLHPRSFPPCIHLQAYGKMNIAHEVLTQNETPWPILSLAFNQFIKDT